MRIIIAVNRALRLLALASSLLLGLEATAGPCLPITGCEKPELSSIDQTMLEFMCENGIPGASLTIARFGVVVYERGFGHSDLAQSEPMEPDAMMRVASVSKPMTVAAVRDLIADGEFTLDTFAFDLGQPGGGLLDLAPFPSLTDSRLSEVRIRHLIRHEGGWDRSIAGDLTYRETLIASAMGVPSPPGRERTVRWILGQPLQFTPGSRSSYSNIGCLVLGLIVEETTGMPVDEFIRQRVLEPIGVANADHIQGRTFAPDQDPREPHYHSSGVSTNVFDPFGPSVQPPYGSWDHEARIGQGGQVTTASTLALFAAHRWVNGSSIGLPKSPFLTGSWRWNHTGTLTGTGALLRQRGDGISYGVIFNTRGYGSDIRNTIDPVLDAISVWPEPDEESCNGTSTGCAGDCDRSGIVDFADLVSMLSEFGNPMAPSACNADMVGVIDFADLVTALDRFGPCE